MNRTYRSHRTHGREHQGNYHHNEKLCSIFEEHSTEVLLLVCAALDSIQHVSIHEQKIPSSPLTSASSRVTIVNQWPRDIYTETYSCLTFSFRPWAASYTCNKAFGVSCVFKRHLCKRRRESISRLPIIWSYGRLQNCTVRLEIAYQIRNSAQRVQSHFNTKKKPLLLWPLGLLARIVKQDSLSWSITN